MDRPLLHRFSTTLAAVGLAIVVFLAAVLWHIDVFDLPFVNIIGIERSEVGEVAIAVLLVIPAFFIDGVVTTQRAHEARVRSEQLKVFQMTMRTVQDVVNNNLNELQFLRMEAEGHVPGDTLAHFDHTIQNTTSRLTALGNLNVFTEKPMAAGPGIDV
jgi:hypothetical protein